VSLWIHRLNTATPFLLVHRRQYLFDQLGHVLNAAVRVVTVTWKFHRGLHQLLHNKLHWLDVTETAFLSWKWQITSVWMAVHHCTCQKAVILLVYGADTQQHRHFASHQLLAVRHFRLNSCVRWGFSCRPHCLDLFRICDSAISADSFGCLLETYLLCWMLVH